MTDIQQRETIAPCPFCGGDGPQPVDATKIMGVWRMIHRCKVIGPISLEGPTRDGVLETWNTRSNPQPGSEGVSLQERVEYAERELVLAGAKWLLQQDRIADLERQLAASPTPPTAQPEVKAP